MRFGSIFGDTDSCLMSTLIAFLPRPRLFSMVGSGTSGASGETGTSWIDSSAISVTTSVLCSVLASVLGSV